MTEPKITQEAAEAYIRDLYSFVLDRRSVSEKEFRDWVDQLLSESNPIGTFSRFANSIENRKRFDLANNARTMYEHGHFYSPVVNRDEVAKARDRIFAPRSPRGISLNQKTQIETFKTISAYFASIPFSETKDGRYRYYYDNSSYAFGDASVYWSMLGYLKPSKLIEIGSGYTSALALDAIDFFNLDTKCVFIDPFPELARKTVGELAGRHVIIPECVQAIDPRLVEILRPNDILFIDSSHVVKTGSDVHFEICELLPRLRTGVIVHFHDIFYPFEYPIKWVVEDNKSWNELYFIHAFLQYNSEFEIVYFNDYFAKEHFDIIETLAPAQAARIKLNPGGGLWLRRR